MHVTRRGPLAWALVLAIGATGCDQGVPLDGHPVLSVTNETDVPLHVVLEFPNGVENNVAIELLPGASVPYDRINDCVDADLVARDVDGNEVARLDGPVCRPSEWVISDP